MFYQLFKKHLVSRPIRQPLADAVAEYFDGDWPRLIADLEWPPVEALLDGAPSLTRAAFRQRLVERLAATEVIRQFDAIEEDSASDEELFELALDEVELDAEDLAALDTRLGEPLLAQALEVYGETLASRIMD